MINAQQITKKSKTDTILNNISLQVQQGEVIGLIGHSGSGKSTLLRCLHGLDLDFEGTITRSGRTGLIFQQFHLFPHMNILDNITYAPIKVLKQAKQKAEQIALSLLERFGIANKAQAYPSSLSGGEKQRVAIARALAMEPQLLLLDEPTSALDPTLVQEVIKLINDLRQQGLTLIIASHDLAFLQQVATRIIFMEKGHLLCDEDLHTFFSQRDEKKDHFLQSFNQINGTLPSHSYAEQSG